MRDGKLARNRAELARLGANYGWVVIIAAVFTLARFSEAFLILRAQSVGLPIALVPMVMVVMNVVYALAAYPTGVLSDRFEPAAPPSRRRPRNLHRSGPSSFPVNHEQGRGAQEQAKCIGRVSLPPETNRKYR